jgi:hypothetical protein
VSYNVSLDEEDEEEFFLHISEDVCKVGHFLTAQTTFETLTVVQITIENFTVVDLQLYRL